MKKTLALSLALFLALSGSLLACAQEAVNVFALKGPTAIGMVQMMEENEGAYAFTLAGAPDEIVAAIAGGNADIAAAPTNLAAALYNKTAGNVQLLALNTLGVLSILENGNSIQSVQDLAGKTLTLTGQGAVPEYALQYILKANGLEGRVHLEYKSEHSELATLAAAGAVDLVMLPEPHATSVQMNNPDFRIALDVTTLFADATALQGDNNAVLSMGCVIVRRDFATQHPDKVAAFLADYAASVDFVNASVPEAALLVEAQGILPKAAIAAKAIPNCHIVFVAGDDMKAQIAPFFAILHEANPSSIGGALPADDFYYAAQ